MKTSDNPAVKRLVGSEGELGAALGLDNEIGILKPGCVADLIILNISSTKIMSHRMEKCKTIQEELFILQTLGDERAIEGVFISGENVTAA